MDITLNNISIFATMQGGKCIVVMCGRPKVEMETTFRRIIPQENRFGCRFVFRSDFCFSLALF